MGGKVRLLAVFVLVLLISAVELAEAVSISPSELTIRNIDERRDYQFIMLLESSREGLVDVELKTSHGSTVASPDKFMLNEGEQRSVRLHLNPREVDDNLESIRVQPYVNGVPTEGRLTVLIEEIPETVEDIEDESERITQDPAFFTLIIYGLVFVVAILIMLIFMPEIRKNMRSAKTKSIEVTDKRFYKKSKDRIKKLGKRLDDSDKRVKNIIEKIEKFHEGAHSWIQEKSGGKYGLE